MNYRRTKSMIISVTEREDFCDKLTEAINPHTNSPNFVIIYIDNQKITTEAFPLTKEVYSDSSYRAGFFKSIKAQFDDVLVIAAFLVNKNALGLTLNDIQITGDGDPFICTKTQDITGFEMQLLYEFTTMFK